MKFMVMHKHDSHTEAGKLPPPEFMTAMGAFIGNAAASGKLLDGEGLGATRTRSRVTRKDGETTVVHGPFAGSNELPAGFAKVTVKSRDEALEIAKRVGEAIGGEVEIEVSRINEAWDLGFGEKPADAPERYLIIHKATVASEAGRAPRLGQLMKELTAKGVVTASAALTPSSQAKRLFWRGGQRKVVDGPFTESKEMIGGYAILELGSLSECMAFSTEYAELLLTAGEGLSLEIDIRPVVDPARQEAER
jgi:hypothetical protein